MFSQTTLRRWQFDQFRHSLKVVRYIIQTADPQALITYRDGGNGWTTAEVIGHLLDCERLFLERAQLMAAQECPDLPFPDQDEDVIKGRYNERDPQTTLDDWQQARDSYMTFLNTLPEDAWFREGTSRRYQLIYSINDQSSLICWHDLCHTEQITRILTEKKQQAAQG
jgi:uncharacterized damage-inducible protein DinB